jgi:hypothetical protein
VVFVRVGRARSKVRGFAPHQHHRRTVQQVRQGIHSNAKSQTTQGITEENFRSSTHKQVRDHKEVKAPFVSPDVRSFHHTMEQFHIIFEYLPTHCIAICKSHRQGIVKSQLKTHLDRKHQEYVRQTRQNIVEAVQEERLLQDWAVTYKDVVYPTAECAPLPYLPVYRDGLCCQFCGYINRSIDRIQEHSRQDHSQEGRSKVGRPLDKHRMWTTVSCQKFHKTNKLGRLFQVGSEAEGPGAPNDADADVSQAIQMSLAQASTQLEELEKKKNNAIKPDTDRHEFAEWLNRAGWARHLKGLKRDWLLKMARKPPHKERALFEVCWAVRMIIWRAQQTSKASVVGMPAMIYINRREFGNTTNEKPFNAQQTIPGL